MVVELVMEVEERERENKVWWSNQTVTGKIRAHTREREKQDKAR